jgi:hypothetical protein
MTTEMATMATVEAARIICGSYPAACSLKTRDRTPARCRPRFDGPAGPAAEGRPAPSGDIPAHWPRRDGYPYARQPASVGASCPFRRDARDADSSPTSQRTGILARPANRVRDKC